MEKRVMTTAEKIAELLGNDGQRWESKNGVEFADLCEQHGAIKEVNIIRTMWRHEFADGSALVEGEGGWDIEGEWFFSWQSME